MDDKSHITSNSVEAVEAPAEVRSLSSFGQIKSLREAQRWAQPALNDLALIIGLEEALALTRDHGGKVIYIPNPENAQRSNLRRMVGSTVAQKLAEGLGPCKYEVPLGTEGSTAFRRRVGIGMLQQGYSKTQVVHALRVSRSTVGQWMRLCDPEVLALAVAKRERLAASEKAARDCLAHSQVEPLLNDASIDHIGAPKENKGGKNYVPSTPEIDAFLWERFEEGVKPQAAFDLCKIKFDKNHAPIRYVRMIYARYQRKSGSDSL